MSMRCGVLLGVLLLAGCKPGPEEDFVGTWVYQAGQVQHRLELRDTRTWTLEPSKMSGTWTAKGHTGVLKPERIGIKSLTEVKDSVAKLLGKRRAERGYQAVSEEMHLQLLARTYLILSYGPDDPYPVRFEREK